MKRKMKVAVAMSGGLDSSVTAAILKQERFEVLGVTIYFNFLASKTVENAKMVSDFLGIRHRVLDLTDIMKKRVIDNLCQEYLAGRTPNPCLRCNQYIKFGALLRQILAWGCNHLATGHYARIVKTNEGFLLKRGKDRNKDQSYFLYRLGQRQLKALLFPLGDLTRKDVASIAQHMNLPVSEGRKSQEICFLAGRDYREFLKERVKSEIKPGLVVDKTGKILGQHQGISFYTVGQREGLNIALGHRAYIIGINAAKNQIVLGNLRDTYTKEFTVTDTSFTLRPIKKKVVYRVKIRYNHRDAEAQISPRGYNLRVKFRKAQFAVTPGQSAVFYNRDVVIGGGVIR